MNTAAPFSLGVTVIIPVYNNARTLPVLLDSLMKQTVSPEEIIVVDDASSDGSVAVAASFPGVRVVRLDKNSGPAVARNRGAKEASQEILIFLDSDVVLPDGTVQVVKESFAARPEVMAINGFMEKEPLNPGWPAKYKALIEYSWSHTVQDWDDSSWCINARIGAIRRRAFMEIGGFNPGYKNPSVEDHELGLRFTEKYPIYSRRALTAFHNFSGFRGTCRNYFQRAHGFLQLLWSFRKSKGLDQGGASTRSMMEFIFAVIAAASLLFLGTPLWPWSLIMIALFMVVSARSLKYHLQYGGPLFYLFSQMLHMIYGCVVVASGVYTYVTFRGLRRRTIPDVPAPGVAHFVNGAG